jgi:hypothetical protein
MNKLKVVVYTNEENDQEITQEILELQKDGKL